MSKRTLNSGEYSVKKHKRTGQSTFTFNSSPVREIFRQNQVLKTENQELKRQLLHINNMRQTVARQRDAVIQENQQLKEEIKKLLSMPQNHRFASSPNDIMLIDNQLKRNLIY